MKIVVTIDIQTSSPLPDEVLGDIRSATMAISRAMQDAIDRIRETTSLVKAVMESEKVQTDQIAGLTQKVTDLQSKLDAGTPVNQDDLAALAELTSDIDTVNAQLRTAVPANTVADPNAPAGNAQPSGSGVGGVGETVNNTAQGSGQQSTESKPTPLPGTGAA